MTVIAAWAVELNADCPACLKCVDLLSYADFWDGRALDIGEHGTQRSMNVDVVCPNCGAEFEVDCVY